ncbi:MAG: class I SAM-dependent methyltransferase [Cyclobacteriaceae bacterium]|nr:class I SAM-dependent methyltransferase [Cyclobacteriaceae bacterium]
MVELDDDKVIQNLIYGWGNQGWSAQTDYLKSCIQYAKQSKGPFLECGSGLTTIVIGIIAKIKGEKLYSLEHNEEWANRVRLYAEKLGLDNIILDTHTLKNYGEFDWYSVNREKLPANFSFIMCDGPPGKTRGGRIGLIHVLKDKMKPDTLILLDDLSRESEKKLINDWKKLIKMDVEYSGLNDPHAIIKVKPNI